MLRNNKAQASTLEYTMLVLLAVSVIGAMTIFFKRTIQARIREAERTMVKTVYARTLNYYQGNQALNILPLEYEAYYFNVGSNAIITSQENTSILAGGQTTGIFRKQSNDKRKTQSVSITAPPQAAR